MPPKGRYKLNTDGSLKLQKTTGGGVIRDYKGSFIAGFEATYDYDDIDMAEMRSILFGSSLWN